MEEEKKFFEEIKQLMNEYVEYDNTEILENWEEEKAILQSEIEEKNKQFEEIKESRKKAVEDLRVTDNIQKSLRKDSHAYKGSKQDFHDARQKSIVKNRKYREVEQELKQAKEELSKREGSVNELIKTRTEQGKEKKEEIYNKTKEFISANTEKMQQEIIAKREKLKEVAKESFYEGIKFAKLGYRLSDISHAIQAHVEKHGFSVVRDLVGHGVGIDLHEDPQIPNYGPAGKGPRLQEGMVLAIEPMINAGRYHVKTLADGWTIVTIDGKKSAHYEHTIAITNDEPIILSSL